MTLEELFTAVNTHLQEDYPGTYCFVSTEGPAIVNQIAMIQYPSGAVQPLDEYLAINPGLLA